MNKMVKVEGAKRATNLTMSAALVDEAKSLGLNLSQVCESGLADAVKKKKEAQWLEENREALESWNEWVEKNGLPLAKYRQF